MLREGAHWLSVVGLVESLVSVPWWVWLLAAAALFLLTGGTKFVYVAYKTLPRDVIGFIRYVKLTFYIRKAICQNKSIPVLFEEQVSKTPDKACFVFEGTVWTYREVASYSNRVANVFAERGFGPGDVVALYMESRPEYVCIWLGLSRIGVCTALINYNLRAQSLVHCVTAAGSKALIFGRELEEAVTDVQDDLKQNSEFYYWSGRPSSSGAGDGLKWANDLDLLVERGSTVPPPIRTNVKDKLMYIYTSGTTGLPKPAIIRHTRYIYAAAGLKIVVQFFDDDIVYNSMPLYHSMGGMLGVGMTLLFGITTVIRNKFSASQFWDDCQTHKCTAFLYVGEICRYLLAQKPRSTDRQHCVRLMFGNGLKAAIWKPFVNRFGVREVREMYGATEGNANIVNLDNTPNSVGFLSRLAPARLFPVTLIKVDEATGEPLRDGNGLCIRCEPGEPGEFIGKIDRNDPVKDFSGYVSKEATQKKIIRDVFRKGDSAFTSGDLLVMDDLGYIYFKDRTGDTFRWRGENVSTNEVEAVVSNYAGLKDCVVYGVTVPECEGRAGMAAIVDQENTLDLDALAEGLKKSLPAYARPLFLRLLARLDLTGTYKLKKVELQKQGFELNGSKDRLFYRDGSSGKYLPLDREAYDKINSGKIRL